MFIFKFDFMFFRISFAILSFIVPAVVHPVAQLQLHGALGMSAVEDGHETAKCVQVAAQVRDCRSKKNTHIKSTC